VSKLLLEFLQHEISDTLELIAAETAQGNDLSARLATGGLAAYREIWLQLHPPEPTQPEPEEEFIDPATIRKPQR
jgi:hypothetical protein